MRCVRAPADFCMVVVLLCIVTFVPAFAVRPHDAGNGPQSLLQQNSEHQVQGVGMTSARASTILGTQLTSDLAIVEQHNLEIQEELEQTTREIGVLNKQLEEDEQMEKSLTSQIDTIREGRKATVKHMSGAMSEAGESAKKVLQDGWRTSSHIQVSAREEAERTIASAPGMLGQPQRPGETSSLLQEASQASGGGYGFYGDEYPGDDQIWNPLREKSQHMEQTLDLLVAQRMKVDAAVNHEKLTLKKLNEDLRMLEVMKSASQAQEDKLRKGRAESLLKMYSAMYEGADAAKQAMSMGVSGSKDQEVDETPPLPPESINVEEVNTTTPIAEMIETTLTTTTKRTEVEDEGGMDEENTTLSTTTRGGVMLELADDDSDQRIELRPQHSRVKTSHRKSSKHKGKDQERSSWQHHAQHLEHRSSSVGELHKERARPRQHEEVLLDTSIVQHSVNTHKAKVGQAGKVHHQEKPQRHVHQEHHEQHHATKRHGRQRV
mmetsp:Transcript_20122/g.36412  ORF Transcript_20122/g.36412 Transcript_20122/m.36412 type:complete len:492 (-) Transcript_20122:157-1632(-)